MLTCGWGCGIKHKQIKQKKNSTRKPKYKKKPDKLNPKKQVNREQKQEHQTESFHTRGGGDINQTPQFCASSLFIFSPASSDVNKDVMYNVGCPDITHYWEYPFACIPAYKVTFTEV